MPLDLTTNIAYLRNIQIYENVKQFYFIGSHSLNKTLLIFTINKIKFTGNNTGCYDLQDILIEHRKEYDKNSFDELISALSRESSTQLRLVEEVKCIFGFVKFYIGYYAILVSEYSKVGKIGDYVINRVEKLKLLPLFLINTTNVYLELESKYLTIFKNFDPSRQVYFSFTYDLTKTFQRNFIENLKKDVIVKFADNYVKIDKKNNNKKTPNLKKSTNNTFLWNNSHIKEFYKLVDNKIWVTNFIYGFFEQIECMNYGLRFLVTVLARRNRHYAGTRYLKRGINNDGNVANDVETEQILEEISTSCSEKPVISSYIHIRGSVPIYWYQEQNSILPKPDIKVNYSDVFYESTKQHFYLLNKRYGSPIIVCNLTKANEGDHKQEELLNDSYSAGVEYLNSSLKREEQILYLHYDLKSERRSSKFYKHFYEISYGLIEKTNMFSFIPHLRTNNTYMLQLQSGVIRSNCVDCLDRTNVFQQVIGTAVMVNQLRSMGVNAKEPSNEEEMFGVLTELYKKMGHELSSQYAGSLAHKQTIKDNRTMMNKIIDKVPELFNTCKRYFNNSFNDQYKQASINLFLGKYELGKFNQHLWELLTDSTMHRKEHVKKLKDEWVSEALDYYQIFNLIDDIIYNLNNENNNKSNGINQSNEINENGEEIETKIKKINKEIFDYIKISPYKTEKNYFLVTIENFHLYKKLKKYIKNIPDVDSFSQLDIDHKFQIQSFYNFNYNSQFDVNISIPESPNILCQTNSDYFYDIINSNPNSNSNNNNLDVNTLYGTGERYFKRKYKTKTHPVGRGKSNNVTNLKWNSKISGDWSLKKENNEDNLDYLKFVEKPKFQIKITSFEMDENEINLANDFVDPDPKYLQNSEYHQLDYFINMEITNENYNKFFDPNFTTIDENQLLLNNNCLPEETLSNEFVEDFLQRLNSNSPKKKEHKLRELKNVDYLIYDVKEKQFYKKIIQNEEENNFYNTTISNLNSNNNFNLTSSGNKLNRDDSPKVKIKVKKLPIKIIEEHI